MSIEYFSQLFSCVNVITIKETMNDYYGFSLDFKFHEVYMLKTEVSGI